MRTLIFAAGASCGAILVAAIALFLDDLDAALRSIGEA